MDYNTCKRLKDAGLPQTGKGFNSTPVEYKGIFYESVYEPTLSELIEAFGDDFKLLRKYKNRKKTPWGAQSHSQYYIEWGETSIQAVANLYLALHEKKSD